MFAREGGEGHDLLMDDVDTDGSTISDLALHKDERDLLEMVRKDFDKVIVLLNSPYQMEVQDIIPMRTPSCSLVTRAIRASQAWPRS